MREAIRHPLAGWTAAWLGTACAAASALAQDEIWKIVAFVRSLYKGEPEKVVW